MQETNGIYEIIHSDVMEIADKVAGISLTRSQPVEIEDAYTIRLSAKGTYHLDLYIHADKKTLEKIASNMKRSPAAAEEIQPYLSEFLNILGGRIVSKINQLYQQSARFTLPVFMDHSAEQEPCPEDSLSLFYRFQGGLVKIEGHFVQNGIA